MSEVFNKDFKRERVRAGMRWFGPDDIVTIKNIRQTPGVTNVISALHHIVPGEIWTIEEISKRKIEIEFIVNENEPAGLSGLERYEWYIENGKHSGLHWDTVESLIFTEEIKNGSPERDLHIENYKESLRNLAKFNIQKVIGNFMLVADWTRTEMTLLDDGSSALEYIHDRFVAFDLFILKRHNNLEDYISEGTYTSEEVHSATLYWEKNLKDRDTEIEKLTNMITAGLPGANEGFTLDDFRKAVTRYHGMTVDQLRKNIAYFLDEIIPVAHKNDIRICCHADDPSFSPFMGTPRAVGDIEGYKFLLDHGCGVNLCVGSLMPNKSNRDITTVIYELAEYGKSIDMDIHEIFPHIHLRPIETDGMNFREGHHAEHREELAKIVHALVDVGWQGVFRPDHAPSSEHGFGRPGYDVIGRGYGAQLLLGLFEMAEITKATRKTSIKVAIEAADGDLSKLEIAVKAAIKSEAQQIKEKIAFIKMPFFKDHN
jgi:mannonate dehydratase